MHIKYALRTTVLTVMTVTATVDTLLGLETGQCCTLDYCLYSTVNFSGLDGDVTSEVKSVI